MEVFAVLIALCGKTAEVSRIQICIKPAITQGSCRLFYFLGNSKDKPPAFFVLFVLTLEGFIKTGGKTCTIGIAEFPQLRPAINLLVLLAKLLAMCQDVIISVQNVSL